MTRHDRRKHHNRYGLALPEWCCVLGVLTLAIFAAVKWAEAPVQGEINSAAEGIGDPTKLLDSPRFDKNKQKQSKPNGNNGLGNGEDGQPPGNPPINDGPGTGPGNPGAKQRNAK